MLDKTELVKYGTFSNPYQIEKDYLQDLLLHSIYSKSESQMVFKGGTALSKFYYSGRFSEDLDFTLKQTETGSFDYAKGLLDELIANMEYPTSYREGPKENRFKTISAMLAIEGPRYYTGRQSTIQYVRFEINTTGSLLLKPVNMSREPKYRDTEIYLAPVMDAHEIIAEKVRALMSRKRRHKERDLYDMYVLFSKGIELKKEIALAKLEESKLEYSKEVLSENIDATEKTWEQLGTLIPGQLIGYKHAKAAAEQGLKKAGLL